MTLLEMSSLYTESALAIHDRICELRTAERAQSDPSEARRIHHRITTLQPLLREMRELSHLTTHYYDRSYHKHERYSL